MFVRVKLFACRINLGNVKFIEHTRQLFSREFYAVFVAFYIGGFN
jgi:hypothetical protein